MDIRTKIYDGRWVTEEIDGSSLSTRLESGAESQFYLYIAVESEVVKNLETLTVVTGFSDLKTAVGNLMLVGDDWGACTYKYMFEADVVLSE